MCVLTAVFAISDRERILIPEGTWVRAGIIFAVGSTARYPFFTYFFFIEVDV